jgi:4-alpha-glucanotransferase
VAEAGRAVRALAEACGVQTAYVDALGQRRVAGTEALLRGVQALGVPVRTPEACVDAARDRRRAWWRRGIEPVTVAWDGRALSVDVRVPSAAARARWSVEAVRDADAPSASAARPDAPSTSPASAAADPGTPRRVRMLSGPGVVVAQGEAEADGRVRARLTLPQPLPIGYHQLTLRHGRLALTTRLIVAPARAMDAAAESRAERHWGVFTPLYAVHDARSWGVGDLGGLAGLAEWTGALGGRLITTLPLLAGFFDELFEASPYAPVSRVCWNELFLDVPELPEWRLCRDAQRMTEEPAWRRARLHARRGETIDYRRAWVLKRQVLDRLAAWFFREGPPARRASYEAFLRDRPVVRDYGRFRALCRRHRRPWWDWPADSLNAFNPLNPMTQEDEDGPEARMHTFAQWAFDEQLGRVSAAMRQRGQRLGLDLPLGVNTAGFDVWRERELFVRAASVGAPPDVLFRQGQNWGFPPMHPERLREQGYRHLIDVIRHHLRHAGLLRIDHVMGLHRMFWVPIGSATKDGVYVRYPAEELHAILCLEARRSGAVIVGENLGTVPAEVTRTMRRRGVLGMSVLQYELTPKTAAWPEARPMAQASLNTHDMPPFAAYWEGHDIDERAALGIADARYAEVERRERAQVRRIVERLLRRHGRLRGASSTASVLEACVRAIASGPAHIMVVSLEDTWLETRAQNVPGTYLERPNWRYRLRHALEAVRADRTIADRLRLVDRARADATPRTHRAAARKAKAASRHAEARHGA